MRTLGEFRLIHEVSKGGMGIVYEAPRSRSVGGWPPKVYLPYAAALDPRQPQAVLRGEAKLVAELNHRNIVPITSSHVGGPWILATARCSSVDGHTLAGRTANSGNSTKRRHARNHRPLARATRS